MKVRGIAALLLCVSSIFLVAPPTSEAAAAVSCTAPMPDKNVIKTYRDSAGNVAAKLWGWYYVVGDNETVSCFKLSKAGSYRDINTGFMRIRVCDFLRENCNTDTGTNVLSVGPIKKRFYWNHWIRSTLEKADGTVIMDHWHCHCGD